MDQRLTEPAGGGPVDWRGLCGEPTGEELGLIYHDCCGGCELMDQVGFEDAARAVLARYGHQPAPPAEGEVASPACLALKPSPELTEAFKDLPPGRIELLPEDAQVIEPTNRTILVPAPMPVAVSERLPGPEDCDGEGRCWVHQPHEACPESPAWELMLAKYASANYEAMCWLPATALPLPQGEVDK